MSESSSPNHHGSGEVSLRALALVFSERGRDFVVTSGDLPNLPEVLVPNRFYPEIEEFVRAASDAIGVQLSPLRCLDDGNVEEGRPRLYSLLTSKSGQELRDGFRWAASGEIEAVGGLCDSQVVSAQLERDRMYGDVPELPAVPWEWPGGWGHEAREWISDQVGSEITQEQLRVTPVRSWSISSVARVEFGAATGPGRLYYKASPRFFSEEAAVTAEVAARFPEISPGIVAVDRSRGWMLMEDLGNVTLGAADSVDIWCEAMRALARVQIEFADNTRLLDRMNLERRCTSTIGSTLRRWVSDPDNLDLEYVSERTQKALRRLEPHVELVDLLIEQIDASGLPRTLNHGDLDAGNVFVRNGAPVLMDWSDSSVSCPLFDAALIPQVSRNPFLATSYLSEWTDFASLEHLQDAFEASKPIAALERAFHYRRNIVAYLTHPSVDLRVLEAYIPELLDQAASGLERYA